MTIEAAFETRIGRNAADVFRELSAVEQFPEWLVSSGVVRVERAGKGALKRGDRLRIAQRIAGRSTTLEGEITALEPDQRLALKARDKEGINVELDAALVPDGATTQLRWVVRIGLPLRYRLFESMAAPEVKRAAEADVKRLKRRLEAVAK
jgi:uncharacterized protein YndB with AHSA1/START domain